MQRVGSTGAVAFSNVALLKGAIENMTYEGTYTTATRLLASFHRSRLSQLQWWFVEAQKQILRSRKMIVDTQHSVLMLDGMLRELATTRREINRFFSATSENIISPLITRADP